MIAERLIAPVVGAIAVTFVVAVASTATASGGTAPSNAVSGASGTTGTTEDAIVSSSIKARNVLLDRRVTVRGMLESTTGLETVILQERYAHRWRVAARTRDVAGSFALSFRPRGLGVHAMRLRVAGAGETAYVPAARLDVFHTVLASWYGPGGLTACGEELTPQTLGVANRTLPCGTPVTLRYRHRTLRVRVIDRGPYVTGRDYDLTLATKEALGAGDLTEVWANH
ncbi:MAG TPA: septal ring lytic transglycosylase RlpA family protein [Solirubrobacteraceae bacterium]|nr:septal ring lytic transglycosylase RlpA family protein [Solirubrobacteraceae bacterium]